jgi:hypothetical protein
VKRREEEGRDEKRRGEEGRDDRRREEEERDENRRKGKTTCMMNKEQIRNWKRITE